MLRYLQIAAVTALLFWAGCQGPQVTDSHLMVNPEQVEFAEQVGFLMPQAAEADYVEHLASTRDAYRQALLNLIAYYESVGNATKLHWARTELATYEQMAHYKYIMPGELLPERLYATDSIPEADAMYDEAMSLYRQSGGLIIIANTAKLRQSLGLFNRLITDYPSSDKIDDAAYRAARIYEFFKDYQLAAVYYQRTFQWNEATRFPARFRAAYIMDTKLKMKSEALTLYRMAVEKESAYESNTEYAKRRIAKLIEPKAIDEAVEPIEKIEGD